MTSAGAALLLDACVVIDFVEADPALFRIIARTLGAVHVATPLLREEIAQLDEFTATSLGIQLVEPSLALMMAAAARKGPLSFHDWLCFYLATERRWTCVSNDTRLRNECLAASVPVIWGLEIIAIVTERLGLPVDRAHALGKRVAAKNPRITTDVLARFAARIDKVRRG